MSRRETAEVSQIASPTTATVASFDGTPIAYDLYDAPVPSLVLVVPGFWRDRRHPAMLHLAALLCGEGYRVAIADPRGHGDSGGTYGFNRHEHHDVAAVAHDLLGKLPIDSITLIGFSYGGAIAISAAARHQLPLASLLLISPVADWSMIAPRINPFTLHRHIAASNALRRPHFDWRVRRSEKLSSLEDIRNVHAPVSLVHVKNDWLINHTHSLALYEAANEPKELHVIDIEGNYHSDRIFSAAAGEIEPLCREFLARYTAR
jgi:pimeloyl-ACP methyl ester carboxylesterase